MADLPGTDNKAGEVTGALIQAGAIHRVTLHQNLEPPSIPRQLPPAVRGFVGRTEHLATLDSLLSENSTAGAVVISALDGTAGVGKTALVIHWAHRVQHQFPDGTLHVNLRGYGPGDPATPAEVLDGFLRALGCTPEQIPIGLESQAALYRSLVANRRMLIVLDNANAPEQVRPLLPGSPGSLVLITSRASLTGLVISLSAIRVTLDLLDPKEAMDLVQDVVGRQRAENEPDAVVELTRMCARLPLALRIAASRVAARHHLSISDVLTDMAGEAERLDLLSSSGDETTAVRAVFDWSYQKLTEEQARMFRRLGLHPGPEFSVHAAAAVAELPDLTARRLLEELAEVHLIEAVAKDRYKFHDLLRAYAADRADDNGPDDRQRAETVLLEWYVHTAAQADRLLFPVYMRRSPANPGSVYPQPRLATRVAALTWLTMERTNLIAAVHRAAADDRPHQALRLADAVRSFLYHQAHWEDLGDIYTLGLAAARRCGDTYSEAWYLTLRSDMLLDHSRWDEADRVLHEALSIAQTHQHLVVEVYALNGLGLLCLARDQHAKAREHLNTALRHSQGLDDRRTEAVIIGNLSKAHLGLGQYELATELAERGLALRRQIEDREGEACALGHIATVWQHRATHTKAVMLCEEALQVGRDCSYPPDIARILDTLGSSWLELGEASKAVSCWREALEIYDRFSHWQTARLRERLSSLEADPGLGH